MADYRHRRKGPITALDYSVRDRGYVSPCWLWINTVNHHGYGVIHRHLKIRNAHRVAYEEIYGPVAPELHLHHLCEQRSCVCPDHLQLMTHAEHAAWHAGYTLHSATPEESEQSARESRKRLEALRERLAQISLG